MTGVAPTDEQPGALRRLVRRRPWVMFFAGLLAAVPAVWVNLYLLWFWILIIPALIMVFLIVGVPGLALVRGLRRHSRPHVWFAAGYLTGIVLMAIQLRLL